MVFFALRFGKSQGQDFSRSPVETHTLSPRPYRLFFAPSNRHDEQIIHAIEGLDQRSDHLLAIRKGLVWERRHLGGPAGGTPTLPEMSRPPLAGTMIKTEGALATPYRNQR